MIKCAGTAWDVTAAGEAMSQLAGVIGGFVFAGIVVLLGQPHLHIAASATKMGSDRLRALIPFAATFVAMSLNAYVFALIAGESGDSCRRVWTATVLASGMLAVGTVGTVGGICLLVRAYVARDQLAVGDGDQLTALEKLLRTALWLLAFIAPGLLVQRAYEYLRVWYDGNLYGLQWLWILIVILMLAGVAVRTASPSPAYDTCLRVGAVVTVAYSMTGAAIIGLALGVIPGDWDHAPPFVPWLIAIIVILVPACSIILYVFAIDGIIGVVGPTSTTATPAGDPSQAEAKRPTVEPRPHDEDVRP